MHVSKLDDFLRHAMAAALVAGAALAMPAEEPPEPALEPPVYELKLVYVFEGPETEFLFVVGNSGFRTVESLKSFLATLPPDTTLEWRPGCIRMGGEPLLSSESEMEEFKAFCLDHRIHFVLFPSG